MTIIKNCGLRTPDAIACAAFTGAKFVGFVHHAASPRHLALPEVAQLLAHVPAELSSVIVLVEPSDETLLSLPKPDYWQIHSTDPKRIAAIHAITGIPVITALSVTKKEDLANVAALEDVSAHLLFDAKSPGGGQPFDWAMLDGLSLTKPWFLAGGLKEGNVVAAITRTKAPMVDVSSGIEDAPGLKSLEKIASFNAAVLNAPACSN